jgi:hypothetical protein
MRRIVCVIVLTGLLVMDSYAQDAKKSLSTYNKL